MIIIDGRSLIFSKTDAIVGFQGDNLVETRAFELTRLYNNIDLSLLDFKLDIQSGTSKNIIDLTKTVAVDKIILTWTVLEAHLINSGLAQIQLRGFNGPLEKWHSGIGYITIKQSINASEAFPNPLPLEFTEMEVRITASKNSALVSEQNAKESELSALAKLDEVVLNNQSLAENILLGTQTKDALEGSISAGNASKLALDGSITSANTSKSALDGSIANAGTSKSALDGSIATSATSKTALEGTITNSVTAKNDLQLVINNSKINELFTVGKIQPTLGLWLEEV